MGRQLTLPFFVATLVATWYGGIFGVTEIAFEKGIYNFITQGVFWYFSYLIFAFFLVNKVAKYQAVTLPDLVGKIFGPKSAKISGIFNFFNVVPIAYTLSLGLFLQILFGGDLQIMMLLGIGMVLAYSFAGGLRSVVFSDLVQFFIMCLGVLVILIFSIYTFGGVDFLQANLPAHYFDPTSDVGVLNTFTWGLIAMATLVDPNFYQRCFAAKSAATAKKGILISTLIWICFDICTTAGAMYAKAVIPEAAANKAYLIYAIQILPQGLRGLILAGILATILSTLDSYLFLAGTTLSFDLAPKSWRVKINFHRISVILVGMISLAMVPLFDGSIKAIWKTLGSYQASCLLFPVLFGQIFPGKVSDNQFSLACLGGVFATTYWRMASHQGYWQNVDEIYIGFATTLIVILLPLAIKFLYQYLFRRQKEISRLK